MSATARLATAAVVRKPPRARTKSAASGSKKPPARATGNGREAKPRRWARAQTAELLCAGASRAQQGRTTNQDAFRLERHDPAWIGLADGSGDAPGCAKRALALLAERVAAAAPAALGALETWRDWFAQLDAALAGGPDSTLAAVTQAANPAGAGSMLVGACAGHSRVYLFERRTGLCRLLSDGASANLGSGQARITPIAAPTQPGDLCLLLSDGAWQPLDGQLDALIAAAAGDEAWSLPAMLLDAASRNGRADDMTVAILQTGTRRTAR